ncbi:MAG: response regulator [Planctomycetes bacterium]|nr:response regulator [Planctomycetota bacterium]
MSHTVLFVDDDLGVLQALMRRLRKEPYQIRTATSAEEALVILSQARIDLVVSDLNMPGMGGMEFLSRVAKEYPQCVRIMLTGQPSLTVAMSAINNGEVYRFLTKPYDSNALAGIIREALEHRSGPGRGAAAPSPATADDGGTASRLRSELRGMQSTLRQTEAQLRQSQKLEALGRLASGVAHDFNNLLTVINGFSELLLMAPELQGRAREGLAQIKGAGERAVALTRQLLSFSRKQVPEPVVLDLNPLLRELHKMLRRLVGEHIDLVIAPASEPVCVRADPGQVEQVVMNLVVNACDAMAEGGTLTIETAASKKSDPAAHGPGSGANPSWAILSVRDTGSGMSEETKARIFEPFFTTKESDKGTGLGLATVYGIVNEAGGEIEVDSELGCGSTFRIRLPFAESQAAAPGQRTNPYHMPRGTETVLLVEDEDSVRALGRTALEGAGYKVLEARNGSDALTLWDKEHPHIDLLVTDVVMPKVNGIELASCLSHKRPELKILCMSGYTEHPAALTQLLEKNVQFLQKPFTPVSLAQKVREVLDR